MRWLLHCVCLLLGISWALMACGAQRLPAPKATTQWQPLDAQRPVLPSHPHSPDLVLSHPHHPELPPHPHALSHLNQATIERIINRSPLQTYEIMAQHDHFKPPHINSNFIHPYLPYTGLPVPEHINLPPKTISLQEAILLALRNNPGVKNSELQRVNDKFALEVAHNEFEPQYTVNGSMNLTPDGQPVYSLDTGVRVKSAVGSVFGVDYSNPINGGSGSLSFSLMQPLVRGFGRVNVVPWENALDNELIARLAFKNNVINVVVDVIIAYRTLVSDYNQLAIQRRTLRETEIQVKNRELEYKAGKVAKSDLLQEQVTLATTKLALVQQENALHQDYQEFLSRLGLTPHAKLLISRHISLDRLKIPSKKEAIAEALVGNIAYQQDLVRLKIDERQIIVAHDARKPQLDMMVNYSVSDNRDNGGGAAPINGGGGMMPVNPVTSALTTVLNQGPVTPNGPFGPPPSNGGPDVTHTGPNIDFTLSVPIDDIAAKADLVGAEIAVEQAKNSLEQTKEDLIRDVITTINNLINEKEQVKVARLQVALQRQVFRSERIKQRYGRTTALAVSQVQDALLTQETGLVSIEITYLNEFTTLYQILGTTLDKWNIKLRY